MSPLRQVIGAAALGLTLMNCASMAHSQTTSIANPALEERISLMSPSGPVSGDISIAAGQAQVIQFDAPISHSLIADPEIADIVPMTDSSIYLLAKNNGITTLTLFDAGQSLSGVFKVNVTHDINSLKQKLHELAPDEAIEVRSNGGSIVLSGEASSPAVAEMAVQLAKQFGPESVMSVIDTGASKQVMLKVRVAEVERSVSKRMNLSTGADYFKDGDSLVLRSGILDIESFATGAASVNVGDFDISFFFDALEQQGLLTTLAEPNLVAMNGETAYFLAGGEFPIPVGSQVNNGGVQIRIEFKEFGVKLAYTPTVIGDKINMVIEPEVSALDPANGIVLDFVTIPALTTRRASTTVELKNGQSFVIAGLLQDRFETEIKSIPGIGSLPILGALARSPAYARKETELMIIVTPYLVEPYEGDDYMLPTDNVTRPSEVDLFLLGKVEEGRQ
ncbi:MAG: type II and III secretion system protein family protein [Henriciella sp.]